MPTTRYAVALILLSAVAEAQGQNPQQPRLTTCQPYTVIPLTLGDEHADNPNTLPNSTTNVCPQQTIIWLLENNSSRKMKVRVRQFRDITGGGNTPADDKIKLKANDVEVGEKGGMAALVAVLEGAKNTCLKYTVTVQHGGSDVDHDPKLQLTDPSDPLPAGAAKSGKDICQ